jgi:hypothetical protein
LQGPAALLSGFGLFTPENWGGVLLRRKFSVKIQAGFLTVSTQGRSPAGSRIFAAEASGVRCHLALLDKLLNLLRLGCRHNRLTVPFSVEAARQSQTYRGSGEELPTDCSHYVVCLDCGRRFGYDWSEMKVIKTPLHKAG